MSVVTAATSHMGQSLAGLSWLPVSNQPVAMSSAITMGAMPALKALTASISRLRCAHCVATKVRVQDGIRMPAMVMNTPHNAKLMAGQPAAKPPPALSPTFHPIKATNNTLGPGAPCAKAMEDVNCVSVSQCVSSTK